MSDFLGLQVAHVVAKLSGLGGGASSNDKSKYLTHLKGIEGVLEIVDYGLVPDKKDLM